MRLMYVLYGAQILGGLILGVMHLERQNWWKAALMGVVIAAGIYCWGMNARTIDIRRQIDAMKRPAIGDGAGARRM